MPDARSIAIIVRISKIYIIFLQYKDRWSIGIDKTANLKFLNVTIPNLKRNNKIKARFRGDESE
jgi:hypothetical protein